MHHYHPNTEVINTLKLYVLNKSGTDPLRRSHSYARQNARWFSGLMPSFEKTNIMRIWHLTQTSDGMTKEKQILHKTATNVVNPQKTLIFGTSVKPALRPEKHSGKFGCKIDW